MPRFNRHVVIVGTARSGTSWLSEIIATQYRYRMLFEPEHEYRTTKGKLICDKWFNLAVSSYAEENKYLNKIFLNRVDCDWIGQVSNRKFKRHLWPFIPKKFIIKFVRGNLAAQYINSTFQIPVLHILRNPYDVIASQMRVSFPWLTDLDIFSRQESLVTLVKSNFGLDITNYKLLKTSEILALRWCIENVLPIELLGGYAFKAEIIRYENLVGDIERFKMLCKSFGLEPRQDIERVYKRPSSKTHPESMVNMTINSKVPPALSEEDVNLITAILDKFKTDLYPKGFDYLRGYSSIN